MVEEHRHHPLHWVELWNGRYFERCDLHQLGLIIHLGHDGLPCDERPADREPYNFTIVDLNGVHRVALHRCFCPGRLQLIHQMVRADLFPATADRPETAFTRDVLRDFILDFEVSKKSSQDYVRRLVRKSNGADASQVKVREAELGVAMSD